jgi:hypothetical protein
MTAARIRQRCWRQLNVLLTTIVLLCLSERHACRAYHAGDVVDTDLWLDSARSDVLRSQMPMFALRYVAQVSFDTPPTAKTFSLQFEDGLWALPVTVLTKPGGRNMPWQFLERIRVQFIYSKSGTGAIHAVVVKDTIYSPEHRTSFIVEYQWVEQEKVYLSAGQAVMSLAVFVACIYFLLISCAIIGDDDTATSGSTTSTHVGSSVPKWD